MNNKDEIRVIEPADLTQTVLSLAHENYRLVQICATRFPGVFELSYSFALDRDILHIRMTIDEEMEIPSVSSVFPPAFLYENEMKDLFGVKIIQLTTDYEGNFYRLDRPTPYKNEN